MKQINSQKIQNKLRNKFIKSGVKMEGPETIFFSFDTKIKIWDVAAGSLMVKEAGGMVNDINKFDTNNINIRASSAAINSKMLENLNNF